MHRRGGRPGFTLLEVILATTIAVLLLGALYVAVDMQLRFAQMSRDVVEASTLERSLMVRMDEDASHVVALCDPARFRPPSSTNNGNNPTPNANQNGNQNGNGAQNTTTTTGAGSTSAGGTTTNVVLPLGVMGDGQTLHLFISDLPPEIYQTRPSLTPTDDANGPPPVSDLRRVSYWLAGGDNPIGLARQEVSLITSEDALQNLPPDGVDDEASFVLADEVRALQFQYFNGSDWVDTWDSTTIGPDTKTPLGSPLAIAVTVGVVRPNGFGPAQPDAPPRTYRHVLLIPTANGITLQQQALSATGSPTQTTIGGGPTP